MYNLLRYMTGEELLLLRIEVGEAIAPMIDAELDRRALQPQEPTQPAAEPAVTPAAASSANSRAA